MEVMRQLNIFNRMNKNGYQSRIPYSETVSFKGKINILSETNKHSDFTTSRFLLKEILKAERN